MAESFEGADKLLRKFENIEKELVSKRSSPLINSLFGCAKIVKREAEARCPEGPSGLLKKSIVAKKFRKCKKYSPAAFVALDRKIAPHAHLVVKGTVKTGANPFLDYASQASSFAVKAKLEADLRKMIAKAARK